MRRFGPLTLYGWGWDFGFFSLRIWLVYAMDHGLYISRDATPDGALFLWRNR